jgi:hypothetical protein
VFALVKTVELDLAFSDESHGRWTTRIELLQDTESPDHFRCHVWELELFRLIPTFPMDEGEQPAQVSDDALMVERPLPHRQVDYGDFVAPNADAALEIVISDLKTLLEHVTGEHALRG